MGWHLEVDLPCHRAEGSLGAPDQEGSHQECAAQIERYLPLAFTPPIAHIALCWSVPITRQRHVDECDLVQIYLNTHSSE